MTPTRLWRNNRIAYSSRNFRTIGDRDDTGWMWHRQRTAQDWTVHIEYWPPLRPLTHLARALGGHSVKT